MTTRRSTKKEVEPTAVVPVPETKIINRTPDVIAAEIRSIDQQARQYVLQSAIEIGRKLTEAKELVSHGEWGAWLETNVNYSQSTANNFMRVSTEYANSQSLANLTYTQAVALLSVPAEDREQFAEENNVSEMSTRELQAAIKAQKEAEKLLEEERERVKAEQAERAKEQEQREALYQKYQLELEMRKKVEEELTAVQEASAKAPVKATDAKTKTELRKAEKALSESNQRITDLEAEMKANEEAIQAKVDAALKERELQIAEQTRKREEESAKKVAELEEQLRKNNNTAAIKVKLHFENLLGTFNELANAIINLDNEEQKQAISGRVATLCDEMKAKLQE